MPRTDLNVPFSEKDEAKRLGARWDGQKRLWFVQDGVDLTPFGKWLPQPPAINIRADFYYVLESNRKCWKCS